MQRYFVSLRAMRTASIVVFLFTASATANSQDNASTRTQAIPTAKLASAAEHSATVVPPSVRSNENYTSGDGGLTGHGLIYSRGTVLDSATLDVGQPIELEHFESWLIAEGRYVYWRNALRITVGGSTPSAEPSSEAAAQRLEAILSKRGCFMMKDAKGVNLPLHRAIARTKNQLGVVWNAIPISDKSQTPKTLVLPWGQITLIDRTDLKIPSTEGRVANCF